MPEKVTLLNGLKVTSEYWSYISGAYNLHYVKFTVKVLYFTISHPQIYYHLTHSYWPAVIGMAWISKIIRVDIVIRSADSEHLESQSLIIVLFFYLKISQSYFIL